MLTPLHAAFEQWLDQSTCIDRIVWPETEPCEVEAPFATLTHIPGPQTALDACRTRIQGAFRIGVYVSHPEACEGADTYQALEIVDCLLCVAKAQGSLVFENEQTTQTLHLYVPASRGLRAQLPRAFAAQSQGPYRVHEVEIPYTTITCGCLTL